MVYIILGKGFEPMEAIAPCDILRRGGAEVRFAGIGGTLIEGGHGISSASVFVSASSCCAVPENMVRLSRMEAL